MVSISVVICCYNSAKVIGNTIRHLLAQDTANVEWEVILVDNNSTDGTSTIASQVWEENPVPNLQFRVVLEKKSGLSNARTRGVSESQFPIISFIDDDNLAPSNWIAYVSRIFSQKNIGILGCTANPVFEKVEPEWFHDNRFAFATGRLYEGDLVDITEIGTVYGAGMCVRKEIYTALEQRGWEPMLSGRIGAKQSGGEDSELCLAARMLGYKIFYTNEIEIGHFMLAEKVTWERLKGMTHGFGAADVFTLIYEVQYKKTSGQGGLLNSLRMNWLFNYIGKKLVYLLKKNSFKDKGFGELYKIRNTAFCDTIVREKKRFQAGFAYLEQITKS